MTVVPAPDALRTVQIATLVRDFLTSATQSQIGRPRKCGDDRTRMRSASMSSEVDSPRKMRCGPSTQRCAEIITPPAFPSLPAEDLKPASPASGFTPSVPPLRPQDLSAGPSSLSDLSLAVFLESLYTLEIAPSDGLTPSMLNIGQTEWSAASEMTPSSSSAQGSCQSSEYADSAFLNDNLVYSVPSDLRWWNLAWALPSQQGGHSASSLTTTQDTHSRFVPTPERVAPPVASTNSASPAVPLEAAPSSSSCCTSKIKEERTPPPAVDDDLHEKVHCVPNPTGPGCSCLCESDVALLSLQRSLRSGPLAMDEKQTSTDSKVDVASSLVFTLSMSQAITKKCACSADCPTCKKDPSYEISAGLLISTALQIYARALKVFQEVLVSEGSTSCGCTSSGSCKQCPCSSNPRNGSRSLAKEDAGVEVRIGDFVPTSQNARKIALYAMKLELLDLERALAHVQQVAQQSLPAPPDAVGEAPPQAPSGSCCAKKSADLKIPKRNTPLRLNPIDQLIIRKLHVQLSEVLQTVENLEANETRYV